MELIKVIRIFVSTVSPKPVELEEGWGSLHSRNNPHVTDHHCCVDMYILYPVSESKEVPVQLHLKFAVLIHISV